MRNLKIAGLAALIVGISAAAGFGFFASPDTERDRNQATAVADVVPASNDGVRDAVPASNGDDPPQADPDRSMAGASAAAVRFLELTEQVVSMEPAEAAELQRSISSQASADRLAAEVAETLTAIRREVPDGVSVSVAPLGVDAVERSDGWDVSIWYVEVVVYGHQLAVEQWRTSTYGLVWESGGWRMDSLTSEAGPTPVRPATVVASPVADVAEAVRRLDDGVLVP